MASALVGYHGESKVIGKEYFMRQAAILFGLESNNGPQDFRSSLGQSGRS
jgi:hypothetical protein